MNPKKEKRLYICIVIYPITYCCLFKWRFYHGVKGSKLMRRIKWMGEVKLLIEFLAMCRGFYMRNIFFICLCLSSIKKS